jgi:chromosome segregation protein
MPCARYNRPVRFLKHLVLQGYKTFASRTEFVFDDGVTAVIGPNGSGKSNIADALRWVLGEQSYGSLRGKRTEDMIFSGSEQRPRMGMAHVSLILDNSTGWLPIDFSEVEIARRAYRSGENEYYLNGNRVRLRDITELLGSSGLSERTYSIIGQGLVDQALSQRPEERRRLFEEAAGITVYQSKRDQASQKLADAGGNLTRARDIINELTPRLRYLKGQARRVQEYQQLCRDLEAQLLVWYGYKWRRGLLAVTAAKDRAAESTRVAEDATQELNALLELVATRRTERNALRDQLSEWHRASSSLHRESEVAQRELAVRSEQLRLWREQGEDLERELIHLRAALEDGAQRQAAAAAELAEALASHEANAARVAAAQRDLASRERERQAQAARLNQAQDALLALKTQLAERRSRLAQSGERRSELTRGDVEQAQASQAAAAQLAAQEAELAELAVRAAELTATLGEVDRERQAQAQTLSAAQEAERKAAEGLALAQRALARLVDQQDMLSRLRDEGAGLGAGARAVIAATRTAPPRTGGAAAVARSGSAAAAVAPLRGVIGTLGELIEVPTELERAVEAALGGRVQDIVVEGWQDAEAAVDFLKRNQAGRATFLPLDTLRPGRASDVPRMAGVLGLASELVKYDAAIRPAVELALNHTVVVEDLPTARRLLGRAGGATLVTLDGEIVRSSGSVTGGAENRAKDSGMLSRARTMRELPPQIEASAAQVAGHEARVAGARRDQLAARTALDTLRAKREGLASEQSRLTAEQGRVALAGDRARQTQVFHEERRRGLAKDLAGLELRERELTVVIEDLSARLAAQEAEVETARRGLVALAAVDLVGELARLRAEAAVSAGQLQSYQSRVTELATAQQARTAEVAAKTSRLAALAANQAEASRIIEAQEAIAGRLARQIAALSANIDPAEARVAELEAQQRQLETTERNLREQLRHGQMRQSQADLTHQRAHDELAHLRSEIEKDLGLVELIQALDGEAGAPAVDELVDSQPPLPLGDDMVTRLPLVIELPEGLDSDVRNLRAQLGRLGPVNLEALTEYNEVEARYNFLTTQAADLEHAVASLQEIIAELDQVMEREFLATFKAIASKFKDEFSTLFGGGAAKLVLSDPESPNTTGIEIVARPPGKREQGLALLSGGERTLTAAALIFSILKTRPTPFCVLDEVDAALDEANVGRFRDALKSLAAQTQFILITHNRGTIEVADTIYGVSMGADHTSTTLSLRLDGHDLVPATVDEAS